MVKLIIQTLDNFIHDHVSVGSSALPLATSMLTILPVHIADFLAIAGGLSALFGIMSNGMKTYHEYLLIKKEKRENIEKRIQKDYLKKVNKERPDDLEN